MAIPEPESEGARRVQLQLLRAATPARRSELALSLSATVITMAREAIARRHPEWCADRVGVEFVRVHYGAALAQAVRARLARPGP